VALTFFSTLNKSRYLFGDVEQNDFQDETMNLEKLICSGRQLSNINDPNDNLEKSFNFESVNI
jgi:hypothetical protein